MATHQVDLLGLVLTASSAVHQVDLLGLNVAVGSTHQVDVLGLVLTAAAPPTTGNNIYWYDGAVIRSGRLCYSPDGATVISI